MVKRKKYINLKEAAQISGYAPDYIGQLIRKGKIPGKHVYCNIAWMTTEEAVREYAEKKKQKEQGVPVSFQEDMLVRMRKARIGAMSYFSYERLQQMLIYSLGVIGIIVGLFLFYLFSVDVGRKTTEQSVANILEFNAHQEAEDISYTGL